MPTSLASRVQSLMRHALTAAAIIGLAACASKNPLIDEPAPAAAKKPAAATTTATAAAPSAAKPVEQANAGVQTTKERRLFGIFSPYRPDIQQGNFISREQVAQLKTGMTPEQVRFVLGTPLLTDIFHANRWDYPFRLEKGNGDLISSRIAVFFKDNRLDRVDAGELPTEKDYLTLITDAPADKSSAKSK